MHTIIKCLLLCSLSTLVFAQTAFPLVNWTSKNSDDDITIQNGSGAALVIQITVINNEDATAPGVNVKNCGKTTHINAGSSAICNTNDATNPVSFSSDNNDTATGTYQVKQ